MAEIPTIYYGVWIPGKGFLKVKREDTGQLTPFADTHKDVAAEVAKVIGGKATVRYIDAAIASLETEILTAETEHLFVRMVTKWRTWINYYNSKT